MEIHFKPETEQAILDMSARSGCGPDELVENVVAGYFSEILQTRDTLDRRYDDLKSGKVKLIPGDEVKAHFHEKSSAARRSQRRS